MEIPKALGASYPLAARGISLGDRTFPRILKRQAERHDKRLIEWTGGSLGCGEAWQRAATVAGRLKQTGIGKGDRIVVMLPNCIEVLEVFLGAGYMGAVFVPINTACRSVQLRHQIDLVDPAAILTNCDLLSHIAGCGAKLSSARCIWLVDGSEASGDVQVAGLPVVERWRHGDVELPEQHVLPSDPLAILFTSGTSGPSKGVVCPHAQFFWWGVLTAEALGMHVDDRAYTVLPMFHTNALNTLWQALLTDATYVFGMRFSASQFLDELIAARATITYMLGSMVYILLKQPRSDRERAHDVRAALSPATSPELTAQFKERFGVCLLEGYGSTETNLVFSNRLGSYEPGSMGRPLPEFDVRLVDELDRPLPGAATGELLIRSQEPFSIASGYYRNSNATLAAWKNLWFHTGDRVRRDSNGVYYFVDRLKDAIRRRGENISSWEVEQALLTHPDVKDAAVIGVPSELGEEDVMAFVIPREGSKVTADELTRHLEDRIAYFAVPRYFEFLEEFPRTENGKIQKFVLKERGVGGKTVEIPHGQPARAR